MKRQTKMFMECCHMLYVAPEVLRGKDYTQANDIYGLEIIIYEVINIS